MKSMTIRIVSEQARAARLRPKADNISTAGWRRFAALSVTAIVGNLAANTPSGTVAPLC